MSEGTRRDFLKVSGIGAAVAATGKAGFGALAAPAASGKPGDATPWITGNTQKFARGSAIAWDRVPKSVSEARITLNPSKKAQTILGFGAAFTDSACYMLNQLSPTARQELLHQLFDSSEMGFSVCRTCIGASDYAKTLYSFDDGVDPDPELTRFSIAHDQEYILPILREARKVNSDLFLFSSPWSPPGWMKLNNSMLGGAMRRKYMPAYANYFVKFLRGYEADGVPVNAVTVQNEVDTEQDGKMPACTWPQEYEAEFVAKHLGPAFEANGIKTEIWIIDHNYNLWGRALGELETPGVAKYTNSIAWHGYVGQPEWMKRVTAIHPDVKMYWTEGGPEYTAPDYATDWATWSKTYTDILRNGCRSITAWNFALDEKGLPNIGPFACGGLVTVNSGTKEISYSGQYHAFAHYSRILRRGATCFDSQGGPGNVAHVAFENPDGTRVLILTNNGPAATAQVQLDNWMMSVPLEEKSVVTLTWR